MTVHTSKSVSIKGRCISFFGTSIHSSSNKNISHKMQSSLSLCVVLCLAMTTADIIFCPNLRSAAKFTVIAASTVTNTGYTIINGNLSISPSTTLTGFDAPAMINGIIHLGNGIALQAQNDVTTAYNDLMGVPLTTLMTGVDLSGKTLGPRRVQVRLNRWHRHSCRYFDT